MWVELLQQHITECVFYPPAIHTEVQKGEAELQHSLPPSLKSFLRESNGLFYKPIQLSIVWSISQIVSENRKMRKNEELARRYMPFDHLLFFARAGVDGILFAFSVAADGNVLDKDIFAWYPIEDNRVVVAYSLKDYLLRSVKRSLTI